MDKPVPTHVIAGVTPGWTNLRVVDAASGETIDRVREADSVTGRLVRSAVDSAGNLVRKGDAFEIVEETRSIRIEWAEPAPAELLANAPAAPTPVAEPDLAVTADASADAA